MSRRSESIRLKVMPDGHIRAYKYDKGGAGERNVIYGGGCSATITMAHVPKFYTIRRVE